MDEAWDCVVVGGGGAGLSAALVLGRARRRTLLVDAGEQSNLPADGIGGLLGSDGRPPRELYEAGRAEIAGYPSVEVRAGEQAVDATRTGDGFELELGDGSRVRARKLLLATGMEYRPPDLPGLRERWGGTVFHCPFCHGWEVRGRRLGFLGTEARGPLLLRGWSDEVTLFTDGGAVDAEERAALVSAGVPLDERPVEGLLGRGETLEAIRLGDGAELPLDALMVKASMHQRSPLAAKLGVTLNAAPGRELIAVDAKFETSVPGLFAAGDTCVAMPSVANAVASGSTAAAGIVHALMTAAGTGNNANQSHSH